MITKRGVWPLVSLLLVAGGMRAIAESKPNFIVILVDDLGYGDIGAFGSRLNRTPHLDRMAAEGMKLTSFYAATVCTPSRAQLMTGCYAKRVSLPDVLFPCSPAGLNVQEHTLPGLLKAQGYATMCVGKWHLGDQPEFLPTRRGFDHYLGLPYSNDMGAGGNKGGKCPPLPLLRDGTVIEAPAEQDTLTSRYTGEAVKFIGDHKDRPFFLYFAHTAVHVPLHPGADFKGKSANGTYGDWVEEVDWSVGRILDALKTNKIDDKTLVIFTSDNGPWLSQGKNGGSAGPLRGGKGSTWEGGVRVPALAWWPGRIASGAVCSAPISEMDVLPTFVRLGGGVVPADRRIDGLDIWPLLAGKTSESPHDALLYFSRENQLKAVRSGPWKLAIGAPASQLYNLEADIGETTDLAAQQPDVVARLHALVRQVDADLGVKWSGPGVRKCGRVNKPEPLLKRMGVEYD